jgi:hypothetical protein
MSTKFNVVNDDITRVPSDVVLLKHAGGFFGADEVIANRLATAGRCSKEDLALLPKTHLIVDSTGVISSDHVVFLGTLPLFDFGYNEMREFAEHTIAILAQQDAAVNSLTTTVHGANYGLDAEESLLCLVTGFEAGLDAHKELAIREISFVERDPRRASLLLTALHRRIQTNSSQPAAAESSMAQAIPRTAASSQARGSKPLDSTDRGAQADRKRHVFVAMPFSEDFEDVYEYGIYTPVRNCGLICEKTNEMAYTGDILHRIREKIETADLVVADLTGARPNVYLEVGYAWGKGIPVIFVARNGEELHFDVSRHRCIYYKSIRQLGKELDRLIRGVLNLEDDGSG